jgi:hypothetical protein
MSTSLTHSPNATASLPFIFTARPDARTRMRDFFSSHIRNPNTRRICTWVAGDVTMPDARARYLSSAFHG